MTVILEDATTTQGALRSRTRAVVEVVVVGRRRGGIVVGEKGSSRREKRERSKMGESNCSVGVVSSNTILEKPYYGLFRSRHVYHEYERLVETLLDETLTCL